MSDVVYMLTLHKTYYDKGFFNLGVDVDRFVRKDSGPAVLLLGESRASFDVHVNREANRNGTARVMGGVAVREWLQRNLRQGDLVEVHIIAPDRFWLCKPASAALEGQSRR